jgi:hypothetical protein
MWFSRLLLLMLMPPPRSPIFTAFEASFDHPESDRTNERTAEPPQRGWSVFDEIDGNIGYDYRRG